jgi:serine/threonine protein phosphatase PrpC
MATPTQVNWSALSHTGKFRKDNEDSFLALLVEDQQIQRLGKIGESPIENKSFVFAVSDGMGGANAGEFASRIAVEMLTRFTSRDPLPKSNEACQNFLKLLFQNIHEAINQQSRAYEECRGMGATLSLCLLQADKLHYCHIGDSRIYRYTDKEETEAITQDDNHVGWLYSQGKINEHQARSHPKRSSLQQVLGGKTQFLKPQVNTLSISMDETFVICSDGVVEGLANRAIRRHALNGKSDDPRTPAERIVLEAVEASGRDNTTALVFRLQ